jgi:hypothetical protein
MRELKTVADGSLKRIEVVERRVETPPPPPPPPATTQPPPTGKMATGRSPSTTEKMMDPLRLATIFIWKRGPGGIGEGILSIPPRPPDMGASHSALSTPNFHTDPIFWKIFCSRRP